jgi:hypothetical protein
VTYDAGRKGNPYWKARQKVLANATHCAICGGELDFNALPRSPRSPSVDHIITLKALRQYPPTERHRLSTSPENMRPAHYGCNSSRGDGRTTNTSTARRRVEAKNRAHPALWRSPDGRPWSRDWGGGHPRAEAT